MGVPPGAKLLQMCAGYVIWGRYLKMEPISSCTLICKHSILFHLRDIMDLGECYFPPNPSAYEKRCFAVTYL